MAPKKDEEGKEIVISQKDYLSHQNFLAQSLTTIRHSAWIQLQGATQLLGSTNAALRVVQTNIKNSLSKAGIEESSIPTENYPEVVHLLGIEQGLLTQGTHAELPSFPKLGAAADNKAKPKKQKKPRDPNAPKKPVTAFFLYLAENREATAKQMPPDTKPGEIQNRNKEIWNTLPKEEQDKYKAKYMHNYEEYKKKMEAYKARGGQVEEGDLQPEDPSATPKEDEHSEKEDSDAASSDEKASESESESSEEEEEDKAKTPTPPPPPPPPPKEKKSNKKSAKKEEPKVIKEPSPEKKKRKGKRNEKLETPPPTESKKRKESPEPEPTTQKKKKKKHDKLDEETKRKKRQSQGYGDDF